MSNEQCAMCNEQCAMNRRDGVLCRSEPRSPSPCPLPQGEGIPCAAVGAIETFRTGEQWQRILPLPGGEGWGEGGRRYSEDLRLLTGELISVHGQETPPSCGRELVP